MTILQEKASLHEKAVQAVANGTVTPIRQGRRAYKKHMQPVQAIKVNSEVWAAVQKLLKGSYTRFEIISETEVVVR